MIKLSLATAAVKQETGTDLLHLICASFCLVIKFQHERVNDKNTLQYLVEPVYLSPWRWRSCNCCFSGVFRVWYPSSIHQAYSWEGHNIRDCNFRSTVLLMTLSLLQNPESADYAVSNTTLCNSETLFRSVDL